jgi:hypothetical protein
MCLKDVLICMVKRPRRIRKVNLIAYEIVFCLHVIRPFLVLNKLLLVQLAKKSLCESTREDNLVLKGRKCLR